MTKHSKAHLGRQLLVMTAVLLGAILLLIGLLPPQEAQGKEHNAAPPAQGNEETQNNEWVLDRDPQGNEYVAGELLVTYEKEALKKAKEEAPKKVGAKVEKGFPEIEMQYLSVPEVKHERSREARQNALERKKKNLEQDPDVKAVDYNYVREGSWIPNDTRYSSQWALPKTNAPHAWDSTRGSSSVRVAILDSGFNSNHVDLLGKVVGRWDFVNNDGDPQDDVAYGGHGTLVAGIVAANTNNSEGVAGTCPGCSLLIAKVLNADNKAVDANVISGINWAVGQRANVINMSFGLGGSSTALETAINNAWSKGAVVVAAAGNEGSNNLTVYPAAYPNVIAVAATDSNDARATWDDSKTTNKVEGSNAGSWVDVTAPGKGILTTTSPLSAYDNAWGTSMAAPHVSGLAGLLFSKGSMSNAQVRNKIESTAKDLGTAGKDDVFGSGRIDALAALSYQENDPAITYSGSWSSQSYVSGASGNYVKIASGYVRPASAKLSFTGNRVTWWTTKGPRHGVAYVYVDGSYADEIDLYSSPTVRTGYAAFTKSWATSGNHTIEIVAQGTSGRPRVDVDAFTVTQPR